MKTLLTLILTYIGLSCFGQFDQYNIKGQYDETFTRLYPEAYYNPQVNYYDNSTLGDGISYKLKSLLRIYKSTGDRDYLIKFI